MTVQPTHISAVLQLRPAPGSGTMPPGSLQEEDLHDNAEEFIDTVTNEGEGLRNDGP
jgi:hypothetical protein